jgi:hypothetical protein
VKCNCIKKIELRVAQIQKADMVSMEHFGSQCSEFGFRPYKKDGQLSKCWRYTHIDWVYCPFCGIKIKSAKRRNQS